MNKARNLILKIFNLLFSSTLLFSLDIKPNNLTKYAILKSYCLVLENRSQQQEGFTLDTKIKTLNDYVSIKKLQAGDVIASIDGQIGQEAQYTINEMQLEFKSKRKKKEQQRDSNAKIKQSNSYHKIPTNDPDDDWLPKYKIMYKTIISKEIAQEWFIQLNDLYTKLEANMPSSKK